MQANQAAHTHTENGEQTDNRNVLWCEVCEYTAYPNLLHGTIASMSPHMIGVQPPSLELGPFPELIGD